MPAPSEEFDKQVDELSAKYGVVAAGLSTLIASLAAGALTPATLRQASQTTQDTLTALLGVTVAWINLHVPRVYQRGVEQSLAAVAKPDVDQEDLRRQAREVMRSNEHRVAMETLAESLHADLQGAIEGMGRDANRSLGEIRRRNVQQALAKGAPLVQVEDFAGEMRDRGIRFQDKSGRRWRPEAYAAMSLRTHVATILNYGHLNKALEMGSLCVHVFDGGPGDVDEPCKRANGQTWAIAEAIRNPLEHPNCFPAGTVVSGPAALASTARWFEGDLVEIRTRRGRLLTVTPNHPILTSEGWVEAGACEEGSYVYSTLLGEGSKPSVAPHEYQVPALIEDVAATVGGTGSVPSRVVPTTSEDFHGDGIEGEVCVIRSDSFLDGELVAHFSQPLLEEEFVGRGVELAGFASLSSFDETLERVLVSSPSIMGGGSVGGSLLGSHASHTQHVGLRATTQLDSGFGETALDAWTGDPEAVCQHVHRFASHVELDEILDVRLRHGKFAGHVYNLETIEGWYFANGIIAHNCRRSFAALDREYSGRVDREAA